MTITIGQLNVFFFVVALFGYVLTAWLFYGLSQYLIRELAKKQPDGVSKQLRSFIYVLFVGYYVFIVCYGLASGILSPNRFQLSQTVPAAPSVRTMPE